MHQLKLKSREEIALYIKLKDVEARTGVKFKKYSAYYMVGNVKVELLDNKNLRIDGMVYWFRDGIRLLESGD